MNEIYRPIIDELASRSVSACLQREDQLVISRQGGPVLPSAGNSFWITHQGACWYLCTWSPHCYRVPAGADLVGLCAMFVHHGSTAQAQIPAKIIQRFGLTPMSAAEAAETLGW